MFVQESDSRKCAGEFGTVICGTCRLAVLAGCFDSFFFADYSLEPCRAFHIHMQPKSVSEYSPVLTRSAKQHILDILKSPEKHQDHAKRQVLCWHCSESSQIHATKVLRVSCYGSCIRQVYRV